MSELQVGMHNHPPVVANLNLIPTSPAWQEGEVKYKVRDVSTNHIKNATWPERWSPRNEKTRKQCSVKTGQCSEQTGAS